MINYIYVIYLIKEKLVNWIHLSNERTRPKPAQKYFEKIQLLQLTNNQQWLPKLFKVFLNP